MKYLALIITLLIISTNIFSQEIFMKIRKNDSSITSIAISNVDSVRFEEVYPTCEPVTDYDGNTYQTILIGYQCWMAQNLKVTHYPNGNPIPLITNASSWASLNDNNIDDAYCIYNDNANNELSIYGCLYSFAAAIGDNWTNDNNNLQGVCPDGWHIPSNDEWDELNAFLGTNAASQLAGFASLWEDDYLEANSGFGASGFVALPGGIRFNYDGVFYQKGESANFWSSTNNNEQAYFYRINYNNSALYHYLLNKSQGNSVRCIKD